MPIPEHEKVPKAKPGKKPGAKSSSVAVMQRTVQVWNMVYSRGMGLTEIYAWNMDPARALHPDTGNPLPGGNPWGYSFTQISQLVKKARTMGATLVCKTWDEAIRLTLRDLFDLKEKATAGGDYRVAYICLMQIAKIRDAYLGKAQKAKTDPVTKGNASGAAFRWEEEVKAFASNSPSMDNLGMILGPPEKG